MNFENIQAEIIKKSAILLSVEIARVILESPMETILMIKNFMIGDMNLGFEESFINEHDIPFKTMILKK